MSNCPPEYWMWLQDAVGAGARTDEILSYFITPEKMYASGVAEWRLSGVISPARVESLQRRSPKEFGSVLAECARRGCKVLTPDCAAFPRQLLTLPDMPLVLYAAGDESALSDHVHIAIVGTREASSYGITVAQRMSYSLAKAGVTVVSGGALGIDSEAHAGAMLAKGRTVCVLGSGLCDNYLVANAPLRRAITRYGAVISEYPLHTKASRLTFPIRNRLISGLSLGTLVIEAGERSGSLITARCAAEQGRDVFAVPGDIVRSSFTGTNKLIQDGVKAVFTPSDILSEYEFEYGEYLNTRTADELFMQTKYVDYRKGGKKEPPEEEKTAPLPKEASANARKVREILSEKPLHIDEISERTHLDTAQALSSLTELEMYGCACQIEGKRYIIK